MDIDGSVLITGGAGYIGSHTAQRLLRDGHRVVVLDDLSGGHQGAIDRLTAQAGPGQFHFVQSSVSNRGTVERTLREFQVGAVMHFAALIAVGESVRVPLKYWRTNVAGTLVLLESMRAAGVPRMVLSSTAAVYGEPTKPGPIAEDHPIAPINPYGATKATAERMIADFAVGQQAVGKPFAHTVLRYFNVAGADRSGVLGEHHEPETHLIPVILQSLLNGDEANMTVHGEDYPTPDGTAIRDYVHVEDLADAHIKALGALSDGQTRIYNVGTGRGHSVREVVTAVEQATGRRVKTTLGPRRAGDAAMLVADSSTLQRELNWSPGVPALRDIVASAWSWMQAHPHGYPRVKVKAKAAIEPQILTDEAG